MAQQTHVMPEVAEQAEQYFPVSLAIMQPGTMAPVNIYIASGSPPTYNLYKTVRAALSEEVRERLLDHGVQELYVRSQDEGAYYEYVEENIESIIRDDLLPPEKASEIVYTSSSRVMEDVFEDPRSGKNLQRARRMVKGSVLSILKSPDSLWEMTAMASHDYYTYTHCVNVCMFLLAASRDLLAVTDPPRLERIGLGGMLHDIGKSQVPGQILNKPGKLTAEEFELVKEHPPAGVELVSRHMDVPGITAEVIRNHHEHFDGSGYPDGRAEEDVSPVTRLSTIIDVYDALTTERCYAPARNPYGALELMLTAMRDQFDSSLLESFVRFLGPRDARAE
ncbi:MAG: HD domain-containing protein [Candidatus Brocadiaceae bacterium]|jgi:HD-GYP domain-containing protein (c-di-GMP phosphodiesterase class II)